MTSHAAVVARGMGTCCVAGCGAIKINEEEKYFVVGDKTSKAVTIQEGDYISLDGSTGQVLLGDIRTIAPQISGDFARFMGWVDEYRTMQIRTNADNPRDAKTAADFGAEGIGLTRTCLLYTSPARGGIVCQTCKGPYQGKPLSVGAIMTMERLLTWDIRKIFQLKIAPAMMREIDQALAFYLEYYLERSAKARSALEAYLQV